MNAAPIDPDTLARDLAAQGLTIAEWLQPAPSTPAALHRLFLRTEIGERRILELTGPAGRLHLTLHRTGPQEWTAAYTDPAQDRDGMAHIIAEALEDARARRQDARRYASAGAGQIAERYRADAERALGRAVGLLQGAHPPVRPADAAQITEELERVLAGHLALDEVLERW